MEKILISACLLRENVRYNAEIFPDIPEPIQKWREEGRLISVCPEVEGGLKVPRPAAEIQGSHAGKGVLNGSAQVRTNSQENVTEAFVTGAHAALALANKHQVRMAILKARSPSCGSIFVYDGSFQKNLIEGLGVTAALLTQQGIRVFSEEGLEEAKQYLASLESTSD